MAAFGQAQDLSECGTKFANRHLALVAKAIGPQVRMFMQEPLRSADDPMDPARVKGLSLEELEAAVAIQPGDPFLWLQLGTLRERAGLGLAALQAQFQAVTQAQALRQWIDHSTTPPAWLDDIIHAIEQVRTRRRDIYFGAYHELRLEHGEVALARVDSALAHHLKEWRSDQLDPRQRPRFFYFPDLPSLPYLDPMTQPWARALLGAYPGIKAEALSLLDERQSFEDFVRLRKGDRIQNYLGGENPVWEAFFFHRHGQLYPDNHRRCPFTSNTLASIELCRIADHAPEICFSLLTPGTQILPHFGVTNVRVVMHLPLLVPPDCALNVIGAGEHRWREGELMMFDDTFQHEAWNRSNSVRMILLMDCWNPYLTAIERKAVASLIETIGALHKASRKASATI